MSIFLFDPFQRLEQQSGKKLLCFLGGNEINNICFLSFPDIQINSAFFPTKFQSGSKILTDEVGDKKKQKNEILMVVVWSFLTLGRAQTTFTRRGKQVGGPKMSTFCQRSYHRKCQRRGVGGQKSQNIVNIVCERPLLWLKFQ